MTAPRVLVTGAGGYLGRQLVAALASPRADQQPVAAIVATDVRPAAASARLPGVVYAQADVRDAALTDLLRTHQADTVVHLASIVTPGRDSNRAFEYSVDVDGTRNVLEACAAAGVRRIVVSSSGAAYGYHADNPALITEDQPLRGNQAFAYAWHKRLVEEMLARWRQDHPQLRQTIFRIGTILGDTVSNQITALFERRRLIAIRGASSPFVFAWDQDVVACLVRALRFEAGGIFNLAGDGSLDIDTIARLLGKSRLVLPAWALGGALAVLKPLGLTRYGPEQVDFLRYRPVLDNTRLKQVFGYTPRLTSQQVFERWMRAHGHGG